MFAWMHDTAPRVPKVSLRILQRQSDLVLARSGQRGYKKNAELVSGCCLQATRQVSFLGGFVMISRTPLSHGCEKKK